MNFLCKCCGKSAINSCDSILGLAAGMGKPNSGRPCKNYADGRRAIMRIAEFCPLNDANGLEW
jgi:hypothetical protein